MEGQGVGGESGDCRGYHVCLFVEAAGCGLARFDNRRLAVWKRKKKIVWYDMDDGYNW